MREVSIGRSALRCVTVELVAALALSVAAQAAEPPPLTLKTEGYFYVGGKLTEVAGKRYMIGQMYVEYRIPAKQTHPYPVIMVHGGSMSGVNYTGTPDGREGWAQHFVRHGYAVYVVDQPGRGRSRFMAGVWGAPSEPDADNSLSRFVAQEKYNLWPQAHLHTQWPGSGAPDDPATQQLVASQLPAIKDFHTQQELNRDDLIALVDKLGPSVLMVHSQAGAFAWPVADARPNLVKAILAIEPNGPPAYGVEAIGAPDWFKYGALALHYGITDVPLTYAPPVAAASDLAFVQQDKADGPDLVRCYAQAAPARQLPNLTKMPILVLSSEASYHAPYDHCTVKYLEQAGVHPTFMKLAALGIHGNSHVMMLEKNNRQISDAIVGWLDKTVPAKVAQVR